MSWIIHLHYCCQFSLNKWLNDSNLPLYYVWDYHSMDEFLKSVISGQLLNSASLWNFHEISSAYSVATGLRYPTHFMRGYLPIAVVWDLKRRPGTCPFAISEAYIQSAQLLQKSFRNRDHAQLVLSQCEERENKNVNTNSPWDSRHCRRPHALV